MNLTLIASFLVHVVLLPPASLFALMAIGLLLQRRWPRSGKWLVRGAIGALYFLCIPFGATLLVEPLERLAHALPVPAGTGAQAIVVLAAGRLAHAPEYGGLHQPDYIALARLRYAAHLYHATGLPLLVTGGNVSQDAQHESKATAMARALREDFRVPVRWIDGEAETTAQNATNSARLLAADGVHRILLVTDAMHMPRAGAVFRQAGLEVVEAPTVFLRPMQIGSLDAGDFLPTAEALRQSYYALYEWSGLLWYRLRAVPAVVPAPASAAATATATAMATAAATATATARPAASSGNRQGAAAVVMTGAA